MFSPPEYGKAVSIAAAGIGADGIPSGGSATGTALEATAGSPVTPVAGPAAPSARSMNALMRKIANAAVAIILALNLIIASRTADPDRQKTQRPINSTRTEHAKLPHCLSGAEAALRRPQPELYGAGTLMTVFTSVVDALGLLKPKLISLPLIVVTVVIPEVPVEIVASAMTVPLKVPPPAPLMVAALPHTQKMLLAWAPWARVIFRGFPASPTVRADPIWKTQVALGSP
jgi:hypothetical protein